MTEYKRSHIKHPDELRLTPRGYLALGALAFTISSLAGYGAGINAPKAPDRVVGYTHVTPNADAYDSEIYLPGPATVEAVCDAAIEIGDQNGIPSTEVLKTCGKAAQDVIKRDNIGVPNDVTGDEVQVVLRQERGSNQFVVTAEQLRKWKNDKD